MVAYGKYDCIQCQSSMMRSACLCLSKMQGATIMEEAYSRFGLITALQVAMSVAFCVPHAVAVGAFIICRGVCACVY